jgi:hypothetical protein
MLLLPLHDERDRLQVCGLHFAENSAKFFIEEIFDLRRILDFCNFEASMSAASKACQQLVKHESAASNLAWVRASRFLV